jgi:DNA modification methylase
MAIEYVATETVKAARRELRKHGARQRALVEANLERFDQVLPILCDGELNVIDGHAVLAAAKRLGWTMIAITRVTHLSEAELRVLRIGLNKLPELAEWDLGTLKLELEELSLLELDLNLELTGFATTEIDLITDGQHSAPQSDPADALPEQEPDAPAITRPGDLWCLGDHCILCGNALERESHTALMAGARAAMVFSDPPYNIPVPGNVSGLGRVKHQNFAMGCGEMSEEEFTSFLRTTMEHLLSSCCEGALLYLCMDRRHLLELLTAAKALGLTTVDLCVWDKQTGGMGSFYRSQHEEIFVFKSGKAPHRNNVELGRYGRYRTNIWSYPGLASFGRGRDEALAAHPTVKPVALVADAIRDCTRRGEIVLDAFLGSGTTIIAAEKAGRIGYGLELDPKYVDVAIRRWEALTGKAARHAGTGLTFAETEQERMTPTSPPRARRPRPARRAS